MSWPEIVGFLTGAACVWLLVKQNIWTWPVGIANNVLYIAIFYDAKIYGDMALQFFYIAIALYGWWHWLHPDDAHRGALRVSRIPARAAAAVGAVTLIVMVALAAALRRFTDTDVPWLDATTTGLSLAAIFMQSRKWIENWWVWIAADVIYIGLYLYKSLAITAVLYAVFMVMCFIGLREWQREIARERAAA